MSVKKIKQIEANWTEFGSSDPYWSVLTGPQYINNQWDKEKFYASGERQIKKILALFKEHLHPSYDVAIDFGCGPGRLTFPLAHISKRVIGIDISKPMIDLAKQENPIPDRCQFIHNPQSNLQVIESDSIDLVFSFITLQHNAPNLIYQYLNEFVRIAKASSGQILFNLVSEPPLAYKALHYLLGQRLLNQLRKLKYSKSAAMEMHWISASKVIDHFEQHGYKLAHLATHDVGQNWKSNFYLFEK